MRAVIQRCGAARVEVEGEVVGKIERGLTVFLGVFAGDDETNAAKLVAKIAKLRIFDDDAGRFEDSLLQSGGAALVVPNFTLCGSTEKGARPNFSGAMKPDAAQELYNRFVTLLREQNIVVEGGAFGAHMKVFVENDGPVTLVLDS